MDQARINAYEAAKKNPLGFMEEHFHITRSSCPSCVGEAFKNFAALNGHSKPAVDAAVTLFIHGGKVEKFILAAASWQVKEQYSCTAVP